jgi:catechol-2,3-dioxygenase
MKVHSLGHVALTVRDLRHSERFFADILGLAVSGRMGADMTFFRISDDLRAAQQRLAEHGISAKGPVDHTWSVSLYLADPDGNGIELYVDQSDVWRHDPQFTPTSTLFEEVR